MTGHEPAAKPETQGVISATFGVGGAGLQTGLGKTASLEGVGGHRSPPPLLRSRGSDGSRDGLPDPVQVLLGQEDVDARLPRVPTLPKGSDAPEDALADQRTAGVTLQPEVTVRMWGLSQGTHSSFHSFICSHTFSLPHFKATLKVQTHSQRGRGGGGAEAD